MRSKKIPIFLIKKGTSPYNVPEGQLEVEYFVKSDELKFENLEFVEPLEYFDRYTPTKYGILFRQKLYLSEEANLSLVLRLGEFESQLGQAQPAQQKGGAPAKGKEVKEEISEKEMSERRLVRLEIFRGPQLLVSNEGYNQCVISNVTLKPNTKEESLVYYLQATFDLRLWPDCKTLNEQTSKIYWFLKVISSETIGIVRDTEKEDKEKAI